MAQTITFNSVQYSIPSTGDVSWGTNVSSYLVAIAAGALQLSGGAFPLTADASFGSSFGLVSKYFKSTSSNIASSGNLRLANSVDTIAFRNAANSGDLAILVNGGNQLTFNGSPIATLTSTLSASRAVATDGASTLVSSATTATELGFVNGVTSAIQTQMDLKAPKASPVFTGTIGTALTASRALSTDVSGNLAVATTTLAELNFVSGVTSAIQTQINAKQATSVAPTIQKFTSGSGTYTRPSSPTPLYIQVIMVGGGGGGSGGGTGAATNGGAGGNSTFGSSLLAANGGGAGVLSATGSAGTGGSASLGAGPIGTFLTGGQGEGMSSTAVAFGSGGIGGSSAFGGAGAGAANSAGNAGATNTGGGGAGGGVNGTGANIGGGGGAGGYISAVITSPATTYAYAVGAAGTAGTLGTNGFAGGAGGSGYIEVREFYQ